MAGGGLVRIDTETGSLHTAGRVIALANVAGATVDTVPANRGAGIVVAVVGIVIGGACLASGSEAQGVGVVFGLLALAVGAMMAVQAHERYRVRVELVGGKAHHVAATADRDAARAAVREINEAAGRGALL
jgi:hypothetical protein